MLCLVSADKVFFASTNVAPAKVLVIKSTDNGITWGTPVDVTNQIYGPNPGWKGLFVASGRAHQLRDGTLVAAIAVREDVSGSEKINNYMISSTDHGVTWIASTGRAELDGDEAKVVELNNGNLMMSIRNAGTRRFNVSTDRGVTWGTAYNQAAIADPNCDGDFIRYTSTLDGYDKNRLLHSIPFSSSRQNVSVLLSTDEGSTWPIKRTIFSGASAYSSLTILPDGTIGIYYENGEYGDVYNMYFVNFSLNWLTNGADTYTPSTLPLTLVKFGAEASKNSTKITTNWKTADEVNVEGFEVQYTTDGKKFTKAGFVSAKLGKENTYSYSFDYLGRESNVYLRLKMVDNDGTTTFSDLVNVLLTQKLKFEVFPNPVKDLLTISTGVDDSQAKISIVGISGKQLKNYLVKGRLSVNLSDIPAGVYLVKMSIGNTVETKKIIKY